MKIQFAFTLTIALALAMVCAFSRLLAVPPTAEKSPLPHYDAGGRLLRPTDYRDWEFLSAGYGMNYSPAPDSHELFTNVFVQRWAFREFLASGKWPDHSMFVIDERAGGTNGSINKRGHFQTDLMDLAVEVKDSARNPDRWGYYKFESNGDAAEIQPKANCWSCHDQHAAVEHTFVQFYPTLRPVAKKFGTYNETREKN